MEITSIFETAMPADVLAEVLSCAAQIGAGNRHPKFKNLVKVSGTYYYLTRLEPIIQGQKLLKVNRQPQTDQRYELTRKTQVLQEQIANAHHHLPVVVASVSEEKVALIQEARDLAEAQLAEMRVSLAQAFKALEEIEKGASEYILNLNEVIGLDLIVSAFEYRPARIEVEIETEEEAPSQLTSTSETAPPKKSSSTSPSGKRPRKSASAKEKTSKSSSGSSPHRTSTSTTTGTGKTAT